MRVKADWSIGSPENTVRARARTRVGTLRTARAAAVSPVFQSPRARPRPRAHPTSLTLPPPSTHHPHQIVCVNTAACLFAGRFGLAPTVNKNYGGSDSYKMTEAERPRVQSRDPAGFTIVDVAAWGSLAHIISAGEILGQKAAGFF